MTENEAKEILENDSCYECSFGTSFGASECKNKECEVAKATIVAIQALEEIQQYRAIGLTPKMVKEMVESEKLASHQAIIRGAKLEQYEAIGTMEELKTLKEKSVAKKPLLRLCGDCQRDCTYCDRYEDRCPTCNGGLYVESGKPHEHCPHCGQAIDQSE